MVARKIHLDPIDTQISAKVNRASVVDQHIQAIVLRLELCSQRTHFFLRGQIRNQPGHIIDFMATFIELAGATYPKQIGNRRIDPLQGRSLLPIFRGEIRQPHETLYFHFGTDRALRQGPWKLVSAKLGKWELYNMDDDRTELNDLSGRNPERVAAMEKEWFRIAESVDQLQGRALAPVGDSVKSLSFRKDTSSGSAIKENRNKKK